MIKLNRETLSVIGIRQHVILKKQAVLFGLEYPITHGWFNRLQGRQVPEEHYQLALAWHKQHKFKLTLKAQKPSKERTYFNASEEALIREAEKFADEAYSRGELS